MAMCYMHLPHFALAHVATFRGSTSSTGTCPRHPTVTRCQSNNSSCIHTTAVYASHLMYHTIPHHMHHTSCITLYHTLCITHHTSQIMYHTMHHTSISISIFTSLNYDLHGLKHYASHLKYHTIPHTRHHTGYQATAHGKKHSTIRLQAACCSTKRHTGKVLQMRGW
jgi:hypothetical protein